MPGEERTSKPRAPWPALLSYLDRGTVVPVIGPHALRIRVGGVEVPLYSHLANRLAEELGVERTELPGGDPPGGFEDIHEVVYAHLRAGRDRDRDRDVVYGCLNEIVRELDRIEPPRALAELARITDFKLYVTTTFDPFLTRAIRESGRCASPPVRSYGPSDNEDIDTPLEQIREPTVYHLFGRASAIPNYAVTEEDMLEVVHRLQSEIRRPQHLLDALTKSQLLLLGNGFPDWLARFFLRTGKNDRLWVGNTKPDFIVDERASRDRHLADFLRYFTRNTEILDRDGSEEFVSTLYDRWREQHPDTNGTSPSAAADHVPWTAEAMEGSVFVSYASEDRAAALALADALTERAKVRVWIDRRQLEGGDDWEAKIRRNVEASFLFVPVISRNACRSGPRFFRREWHWAVQRAPDFPPLSPFLLPALLDDTPLSHPNLPPELSAAHATRMPGGNPPHEFVDRVIQLYRNHQREQRPS